MIKRIQHEGESIYNNESIPIMMSMNSSLLVSLEEYQNALK